MKTKISYAFLAALAFGCTGAMATSLDGTNTNGSSQIPKVNLICGVNVPTCYCKHGVPCK